MTVPNHRQQILRPTNSVLCDKSMNSMARIQIVLKRQATSNTGGLPPLRKIGRLKSAGIILLVGLLLVGLVLAIFVLGSIVATVTLALVIVSIIVLVIRSIFRLPRR